MVTMTYCLDAIMLETSFRLQPVYSLGSSETKNPQESAVKAVLEGFDVAGASPEIMVESEGVDRLYILKHIKERIRNIFVFLSLPHSFSNIPCSVYSRFTASSSG